MTAAGNLALLGAIYLVTSYGVLPMTRWAAGRLGHQLGSVLGLLTRALPLLLLFGVFLLLTTEVWQVAAEMDRPFFWAVVGFFGALGEDLPRHPPPPEVRRLTAYEETDDRRRALTGTPAEALQIGSALPAAPPLTRRQWGNLGLVLLFSQGLQVFLVSMVLGAFFVGLLVVTPDRVAEWSGAPVSATLATFRLWGREIVLTIELLWVSGFLAAFSGLFFSVTAVTDDTLA